MTTGLPVDLACPKCQLALEKYPPRSLHCPSCHRSFCRQQGIWRFLDEREATRLNPFIADYDRIREGEGRGSSDSTYYRQLPEVSLEDPLVEQWRVRRIGFNSLLAKVIHPLASRSGVPLFIADLGAGNCWLSNRLTLLGHVSIPVDIRDDPRDGLGCHQHFESTLSPLQASFVELPFLSGIFDLVIFNAAVHYGEDLAVVLTESLRVLGPEGQLVILDSPIYRDVASGRLMVREREADFSERFGIPSNRLESEHFLTWTRLEELGNELAIRWQFERPNYGLRWRLRRLKQAVLRRRELADFALIIGSR